MTSRRIRFIHIGLAVLCFLVFFGQPSHAVEVVTESRLMTPGGACERSGTIKLIFDENDRTFLYQKVPFKIPFEITNYLYIRIELTGSGENAQTLTATLCENLHGTATAQDTIGTSLLFSGELIPLDETGVEVSDFHTSGSPDVTAYLHGDTGDSYVELFITEIEESDDWSNPALNPWIEIGLKEELSGEATAIFVNASEFTQNSFLNISPTAYIDDPTDSLLSGSDAGPIGYFQSENALPTAETEALTALYNSTNGPGWTRQDSWLGEPGTECGWYGVECEDGHVVKLLLGDNNLNGTIPPEIGNLTYLKELMLDVNNLTGNIPPEIGSLYDLEELALNENSLSGSIPAELGNLESLTYLSLWENQLTGSIPSALGSLSNLSTLYLGMNQLTGSIPPELGNLSQLTQLHLLNNQLTGSIPPELGKLNSLQELILENNQLSGDLPKEIGNLSQLMHLKLSNNQLSGEIPGELGNLKQLEQLIISENQLTGNIPAALGSLGNLKEMLLYGNELTGSIPSEIGSLPNLEYLYLSSNQLSGGIPKELGKLTLLKELKLYDNQLTETIPVEIGELTNLIALKLNDNQLNGSIPDSLGSLTALKELHLGNNQLDGTIPASLGSLTNLETLYLQFNQFTGALPGELGSLSALKELVLHNNHLEGQIPAALGGLSSLEYLYLDSNLFSGPVPLEITQLTALKDGENEFRWNALYTDDPNVRVFLNAKQSEGNWESTQTVAPTNLNSPSASETAVTLSWTPITYTDGENSGYEVYFSEAEAGPFDLYSTTPDKLTSTVEVSGLEPQTTYYFRLRTKTVHYYNTIYSEYSQTISAATQGETPVPPDIPAEESAALSDLFTNTGGKDWTDSSGWLDGNISPCDGWHGIKCENSHVVELDLADNNLIGTLPASFSSFSKLQVLRLGKNQLTGDFLAQIVSLTDLQILDLSESGLTGGIPAEIGNLVNLKELLLYGNQLTGSIPTELGNLTLLEMLKLGSNQLSGNIPKSLGRLLQLIILDLSYNQLEGNIPDAFGSLTALVKLFLNNNILTGAVPPSLGNLSNLEGLNLSENQLSQEIPSEFGQLNMLVYLNLGNNELTGPVPEALTGLKNLENNGSEFRYNYLFLDPPNADLNEFLKQKQIGGDWQSSQTYSETVEIPAGLEQKDFSMVSFPVKPSEPSAEAVLGIVYNTDDYRIGTYDPVHDEYKEYDQGLMIRPGTAYWFFSRNGDTLTVEGNPVSRYEDYDLPLAVNSDMGYGWNMIGPPSSRRFNWNLIQVVAGDEDGIAIPISDPRAADYIADRRIWSWENNTYVYYQPGGPSEDSGFDYDASLQLEVKQGVWVKALKPNLSLRFPGNAEDMENPEAVNGTKSLTASIAGKTIKWAEDVMPSPQAAIADTGDSPPAPISGFTAGAVSRTDGGGGCFVQAAFGR